MADKVIQSLVYKLIADEADLVKSLKASEKRLDALGDKFISVGKKATLGLTVPIIAAGTAMVAAAVEAEKANKLLENAIVAAGNQGKVSAKNLAEYAGQLQLVSKYDDEATLSAFTLLEQMTSLDEDGLKALMPSIQNLASALDMDLQSAASLVGKTIGSDTNALGRYGIEVDSSASKSEKMAQVLQGLAKYQGAAATEAGTFSGKMSILKNQIGDLAEQFGNELLPILSEVVSNLSGMVKQFSALSPEQKRAILGIAGVTAAIGPMLIGVGNAVKAFSTLKVVMDAASGPAGWITLAIAGIVALGVALGTTIQKNLELNKIYEGKSNSPLEQQLAAIEAQANSTNAEYDAFIQKTKGLAKARSKENEELERQNKLLEYGGQAGIEKEKARLEAIRTTQQATIKTLKSQIEFYKDLEGAKTDEAGATATATASAEEYKKAMDGVNDVLESQKTDVQKLQDRIDSLSKIQTTSADDENKKNEAILALRWQIIDATKKQGETQSEASILSKQVLDEEKKSLEKISDQIDALEALKTNSFEEEKLRQDALTGLRARAMKEIDAETKANIDKVSGYAQIGLKAVNDFSKIMQTDLSESWDELSKRALELTSEIGKATGTQEGMIVAVVADSLTLVVDLVDGVINYEKNITQSLADTTNEVNRSILDNKIETLDAELKATIATIDAEEKAALEKAGFIEDTEVQALEKKLAAETDAEKQAALEKEIAKAKIEEEYQKKRDEANAAAEKERRRLEHDRAIWDRDIMLAKIKIEEEKAIAELGWFNQDKKDAVRGLYAELRNSVNEIPIPALARGGSFIVPSGFEQDSFPIPAAMVSSGERVTVETPEQQMGGGREIHLHVGTLVADDSGLRALNRELNRVSPIESLRRG